MRQFFECHTLPVIAAIYVKWRIWSFLVTRGILRIDVSQNMGNFEASCILLLCKFLIFSFFMLN